MYPNHSYLGLDLSPQAQKQLDSLRARLVIVQEKIAALSAVIASPDTSPAKKKSAEYWLKIRQKESVALQAKIAKLISTPAPPIDKPPTEPPIFQPPIPNASMTPVWLDPVGAVPGGTYQDDGGGAAPIPPIIPIETPGLGIGTLALGGLALFLFGQTSSRRASA